MFRSRETVFDRLLDDLTRMRVHNPVVRIENAQGELIFEGATGLARPDGPAPMTADIPFHLASVTKTMTAVALIQQIEQGRAGPRGLDATVAEMDIFSPAIVDRLSERDGERFGDCITLRHLLTHTSGMLDALDDDGEGQAGRPYRGLVALQLSPGADAQRSWRAWDPDAPNDPMAGVINYYLNSGHARHAVGPPGSRFHYSDTGFMILGLVIERLAGEPLHQVWRKGLFQPLGMDQTYLSYSDDPPGLGLHREPEAEVWMGDRAFLSAGFNLSLDWAGGGLVSTAEDLAIFMRGLIKGRLFKDPSWLQRMKDWSTPEGLEPPRTGIGLGLDRLAQDGLEVWGRTGAWGARILVEPTSGLLLTGTLNQAAGPRDWQWAFIRAAMETCQ